MPCLARRKAGDAGTGRTDVDDVLGMEMMVRLDFEEAAGEALLRDKGTHGRRWDLRGTGGGVKGDDEGDGGKEVSEGRSFVMHESAVAWYGFLIASGQFGSIRGWILRSKAILRMQRIATCLAPDPKHL